MWELPVELRRLEPSLPIFCDPSHICGGRDLLASVAQKAMDLDFDGLMFERVGALYGDVDAPHVY